MYEEYLINNNLDALEPPISPVADLDNLFNNLTNDVQNFNKYISDVNKQRRENSIEEKELSAEKERLVQEKLEFENYVKVKTQECEMREKQLDETMNIQRQNLMRAESEFKMNMDNSLNEFEIIKNEVELEKNRLIEEKEQFETYKTLELNRIKHAQEMLNSEKNQFEKYKEVTNRKIELENKNIEQKCDRLKDLINQFNSNFKPIISEEE